MPKKNHILRDPSDYRFSLIGISSAENDYRMLWMLNQALDFSFTRQDNLVVSDPRYEETLEFSRSSYFDEGSKTQFYLLSNKTLNAFLLPEYRNIDYILKLEGEIEEAYRNELLLKIKSCTGVLASFHLDVSRLKNPGRLEF